MERAMSVEERIKRAEDIYNRRNGQYSKVENKGTKTKPTKKKKVVKKMLMQIFICLMIYVCFYAITNSEYIFSEEFRNEVKIKLSKENFNEMYTNVKLYIDKNILKKLDNLQEEENVNNENANNEKVNNENANNENTNNEIENNNENINETNDETTNNKDVNDEEGVGGIFETETTESNNETESLDDAQQMEKDAKDIKSNISFITPVKGTISSTFGWRNPTTSTVPKYHTGLDIATTEGTIIKSATDGTVTLVSSEGDYGNHYKIEIEDVTIIYAHCKTLYLKEGDTVKQGQEIAEVGNTGNSTGPHLHFEVRKEDRKVDPQLILDI